MPKTTPPPLDADALAAGIKADLEWDLIEMRSPGGSSLKSDPGARRHVLIRGEERDDAAIMDYVRVLARARLAERVHPLFAGPEFAPGPDAETKDKAAQVLDAACDWFTEPDVLALCGPNRIRQVRTQAAFAWRLLEKGEVLAGDLAEVGLILARLTLLGEIPPATPRSEPVVAMFTAQDPGKPSIQAFSALANHLAGPLLGLRLDLAGENKAEAWKVAAL